jgi:Heterokaryon incompatibility protein (HET)
MAEIYRKASGVTAWLGNGRHATVARFFIRDLWLHCCDSNHVVKNPSDAKWDALIGFLKHPWFNRAWVIQEVVMSSSLSIVYGAGSVPFNMVVQVANELCGLRSYLMPPQTLNVDSRYVKRMKRSFPSELCQLAFVSNTRRWKGIGSDIAVPAPESEINDKKLLQDDLILSLSQILRFCAGAGSTAAKDKIFALMKLSEEYSRSKWPIVGACMPLSPSVFSLDYRMTTEDIYIKCALNLLIRKRSAHRTPLNVLPQAGLGYPRSYTNLPSWAPDWSTLPQS